VLPPTKPFVFSRPSKQQTSQSNGPYSTFKTKYKHDPVGFARDCIKWKEGQGLTSYQEEIMQELVAHGRISVRGPHGLGKTAQAAILVLWFALTRDGDDWKIPTTASAWRQLSKFLWPEIHKWARRLRWDVIGREPFNQRTELLQLSLKLETGEAFAVASDTPELIEGAHADCLFYLFDEAKAIPAGTFDAAEGAFSGAGGDTPNEAYALAVSTPGEPQGRFYDIQTRRPGYEDWSVRAVTLQEIIAAGRVSSEWAEQRKRQWGEQSAVYINRVLGQFASSDEEGVIPLSWVEAAIERWHAWVEAGKPGDLRAVGVDVAWTGEDKTVLAPRYGDHVIDTLRYYTKEDPMQTTGHVVGMLGLSEDAYAMVDVIGMGAGVVARLEEQQRKVVAFNASARSDRRDRSGELGFVNKRAEGWWNLRELLDPAYGAVLALPADDMLIGDLTAPHYKVMSGGKIQVEAKLDIKKRLGRSTDPGDAVMQVMLDEKSAGIITDEAMTMLTEFEEQ
jgi:hypothetical protein